MCAQRREDLLAVRDSFSVGLAEEIEIIHRNRHLRL
jgi:hypothetical protein